jgi:hypothetical protein
MELKVITGNTMCTFDFLERLTAFPYRALWGPDWDKGIGKWRKEFYVPCIGLKSKIGLPN